ncbi:hypothetical protein PGT21_021046 [Puccinia graminis f. sp. tritici]|uniref:RING-type domain-containing protein n=1 Tax=Puccinia graminis f. sp. tritici TaxID=56615 RepID=A0A5B0NEB1_PUCGR|nr:hypothetical protein PGT21_021046 [Puccinia graminis f. sp. tritici]
MMVHWVLFLIILGNSSGNESSIELSQLPELTQAHIQLHVDQSPVSQYHSNQIELNQPNRPSNQPEVSITIYHDNQGSRIASENTSRPPNDEETSFLQYKIISVARSDKDGSHGESSQEIPECPICLDQCSEPYCQLIKCNHYFCTSCIDQWFTKKSTCPVCRASNGAIMAPSDSESQLPQGNHGVRTWRDHNQNGRSISNIQRQMEIKILCLKLAMAGCIVSFIAFLVILLLEKYWPQHVSPWGNIFYPPQRHT